MVDALTKVLVGLYEEPERPLHAVDYVKKYIGAPAGVDADAFTFAARRTFADGRRKLDAGEHDERPRAERNA